MRRVVVLLVAVALAGCGSAQTKEDKPDPIVSQTAQDAPPAEEGKTPPFGKPRPKVPPSALDKRSESLLHDDPPH